MHFVDRINNRQRANTRENVMKEKTRVDSETLISEKEAAQYLGISAQWLRCSRMENPSWAGPRFIRISPHVIRYKLRHLDELLSARVVDPAERISA